MKIAVIGGGIFGCTAAIWLARSGHNVALYEQRGGLFRAATGCNQYRLHRGYHYPRSPETALQSKTGLESFLKEYRRAVIPANHYYLIANDSKVNTKKYQEFLDSVSLPHQIIQHPPWVNGKTIESVFSVVESSLDIRTLRNITTEKLLEAGVTVKINTEFIQNDNYEVIVNATYSNLNAALPDDQRIDYQFEVCEKPVISLSEEKYARLSAVIIDGEYGCIDPNGWSGTHVVGHVSDAIHHRNVGKFPEVPDYIRSHLNASSYMSHDFSRVKSIMGKIGNYVDLGDWWYQYSMFTVRTVLPSHEHDDARPTYVTKHNDRLYSIFSGKIGTACDAAEQLCGMITT